MKQLIFHSLNTRHLFPFKIMSRSLVLLKIRVHLVLELPSKRVFRWVLSSIISLCFFRRIFLRIWILNADVLRILISGFKINSSRNSKVQRFVLFFIGLDGWTLNFLECFLVVRCRSNHATWFWMNFLGVFFWVGFGVKGLIFSGLIEVAAFELVIGKKSLLVL